MPDNEALALAASAEAGSEHPVGRAIANACASRGLPQVAVTGFESYAGRGVSAITSGGARLVVGSSSLLVESGVRVVADASALLLRLRAEGKTAVLLARGGQVVGALAVADKPKPEARSAVCC